MQISTTGATLKKKFGLDSLPHVYITRVLNAGSNRFYFIVFDSHRPEMRIPQSYVFMKSFPIFVSMINATKKSKFSILIRLEKFEASMKGAFFFVLDLGGRFRNPEKLSFVYEHKSEIGWTKTSLEEITLHALKNPASASNFTKNKERDRKRIMRKGENILAKLIDVEINRQEDWVTFKFLTESTKPDPRIRRRQNPNKGEVDPHANMVILPNPSKLYEIHIRILKFFSWLETIPDGSAITSVDVKEVLRIADVQIWSNSPSFHWQGMNYMLSQLGASIYPTDIAPRVWNSPLRHGDTYFLDKHLFGLMKQIDFFIPQMAAMVRKKIGGNR